MSELALGEKRFLSPRQLMIWEKMGSCVLHLPPTTLSLLRSLTIKLDQKFSRVEKSVPQKPKGQKST